MFAASMRKVRLGGGQGTLARNALSSLSGFRQSPLTIVALVGLAVKGNLYEHTETLGKGSVLQLAMLRCLGPL